MMGTKERNKNEAGVEGGDLVKKTGRYIIYMRIKTVV